MTGRTLFTLRPEVEADAAFRFALFRTSRGPGWEQLPLPPELMAKIMEQQFQVQTQAYNANWPDARLEIVMVENLAVGRLATHRAPDALHLIDIALTPAWRGRGLGEALLRMLMDEALARTCALTLNVDPDNRGALQLYKRLGFIIKAENDTHLALSWPPQPVTAA
jgi:ribosomal protein S18 acetylase RimI-like enzyme